MDERHVVREFQNVYGELRRVAEAHDQLAMQFQQEQLRRQQQAAVDAAVQIITRSFDRTSAYTNAVILAGYAGFFTIWGIARGLMPATASALVGLLLIFSTAVFVVWNIYLIIATAWLHKGFADSIKQDPAQGARALDEFQKRQQQGEVSRFRAWALVVILASTSGVAAAAIMVWYFAAPLVQGLLEAIRRVSA